MLHVINGDATAARLPSSLPGAVTVWRELLVEGPVADLEVDALAEMRAPWLEHRLGVPRDDYLAWSRGQARALATVAAHDELVLWFEQDLFCVANLAYIAAWLERTHRVADVSLIFPAEPLGRMDADALRTLFEERLPLGESFRRCAAAWWDAYRARVPPASLGRSGGEPFLDAAWLYHLARFPSVANGLGAVESALLDSLEDEPRPFASLFHAATVDERIRHLGMSDLQLAAYVHALADGPVPLVRIDGDGRLTTAGVRTWAIAITADGRDVRAGRRDRVELQPLDWWLGGVRLLGGHVPCRYAGAGRLVGP